MSRNDGTSAAVPGLGIIIAAVSQRMAELCDTGLGDFDYSLLAKPYPDPP